MARFASGRFCPRVRSPSRQEFLITGHDRTEKRHLCRDRSGRSGRSGLWKSRRNADRFSIPLLELTVPATADGNRQRSFALIVSFAFAVSICGRDFEFTVAFLVASRSSRRLLPFRKTGTLCPFQPAFSQADRFRSIDCSCARAETRQGADVHRLRGVLIAVSSFKQSI
jgi:hypothetical protein